MNEAAESKARLYHVFQVNLLTLAVKNLTTNRLEVFSSHKILLELKISNKIF